MMQRLARAALPLRVYLALFAFPRATLALPQQGAAALNSRGEHVMGFSHDKTTHHFGLTKTGGIIQVRVKDATDLAIRDHIRMHLQHISKAFAEGDFEDPMEVHAEVPPGVPAMKKLKDKITYRYESIANGGRVVIRTDNADALEAVHNYLQYQIREHKTGDSLEVR
jgi:hypothetical protein